jgi:hypothetical protein
MSSREQCLREMEASAMEMENRLGGDRPPETWTEAEHAWAFNHTQRTFQRLSAKYSEADMRWAAMAIKDPTRYPEQYDENWQPLPTSAHRTDYAATKPMGYWQSVGTRMLVSFVVVGLISLISVACQASGR